VPTLPFRYPPSATDEMTLARDFSTLERLLTDEMLRRHFAWVGRAEVLTGMLLGARTNVRPNARTNTRTNTRSNAKIIAHQKSAI
jgi:hypothetical protein